MPSPSITSPRKVLLPPPTPSEDDDDGQRQQEEEEDDDDNILGYITRNKLAREISDDILKTIIMCIITVLLLFFLGQNFALGIVVLTAIAIFRRNIGDALARLTVKQMRRTKKKQKRARS